ncbi:MAG TPA: type I methionyl aminopeptidase [Candidatus Latescibacteria bacterium]|nr:type I methionyl aminopeptidase [Gemmatimonadaceae bacterium]MDP6018863.1 type I methionyl aminopeptidase [Candidatus Latescibacterota bacterium]HJP31108.1 type I methionyl aminopeptidase [Candidatus Latescibacterota bacterium]
MIPIRSAAEIDSIRAASTIVHSVQIALEAAVAPGVSTQQLDELAEATIRDRGGIPAFKGYHDFPSSICASINAEAVHGFPRDEPLQDGDVVCVDVGVKLDGWFGDGAFTIGVGQISAEARQLLATTRGALDAGIEAAVAGGRLTDISHAVELAATAGGASVIREYGGHGIGRGLHEDPHILNYGPAGRGPRLKVGHVFAIEPILSLGSPEVVVAEDGWTTVTTDGSLAAHFEHTVALTADGPSVLTLPAGQPAVGVPA